MHLNGALRGPHKSETQEVPIARVIDRTLLFVHLEPYPVPGEDKTNAQNAAHLLEMKGAIQIILEKMILTNRPHYKSYRIDGQSLQNVIVTLRTQFGLERVRVVKATHLLAPALKNHPGGPQEVERDLEIVQKRFPHLKCYFITGVQTNKPLRPAGVQVELHPLNPEFRRELEVQVGMPRHLCVPAAKTVHPSAPPPPELVPSAPHYKCYEITDQDAGLLVRINTQFGEERTLVHKARALCVPALKNPTGTERDQLRELDRLQRRFAHIKCYEIDGATPERNRVVNLRTQFSAEPMLQVGRSQHLCVPVKKRIRFIKEVDVFLNSKAEITVDTPSGSDTVKLSGPTIVVVDIEDVTDSDGNGLDEVNTEIVQMEFTPEAFEAVKQGAGPLVAASECFRVTRRLHT